MKRHRSSRAVVLEVFQGDDDVSISEEQDFVVVRTLEEHIAGPISGEPGQITCEVCGRALGLTPDGFEAYSVDPSTIVLCYEHLQESVMSSIWPDRA